MNVSVVPTGIIVLRRITHRISVIVRVTIRSSIHVFDAVDVVTLLLSLQQHGSRCLESSCQSCGRLVLLRSRLDIRVIWFPKSRKQQVSERFFVACECK